MKRRSIEDVIKTQAKELVAALLAHGAEGGTVFTWNKTLSSTMFPAFTDSVKTCFYINQSRMDRRCPYIIETEWETDPTHAPFTRGTGAITHSSSMWTPCDKQLAPTTTQRPVDMREELSRLSSYITWTRVPSVLPVSLAKAGLYFIGPGDTVQCAFCNEKMAGWVCTGDPREIHAARFSRSCPFVMGIATSNIPIHPKNVRKILEFVVSENPIERAAAIVFATMSRLPTIRLLQYAIGNAIVEGEDQLNVGVLPCSNGDEALEKDFEETMPPSTIEEEGLARGKLSLLLNSKKCKICFNEDIETILMPCRHLVCCIRCSAELREPRRCPICRRTIKQAFRVYII